MEKIYYKYATVEQIAEKLKVTSRQLLSSLRKRYKDCPEVLDKIENAVILNKGIK